jgi:hypothetical protein
MSIVADLENEKLEIEKSVRRGNNTN